MTELLRTGIYGGSFNPIHYGHIRLAQSLCSLGLVDELWLMVSPLNPFKQNDPTSTAPAGKSDMIAFGEQATSDKSLGKGELNTVSRLPFGLADMNDQALLADEARLRLAHLALDGLDGHIRVSSFEMRLPRPSYMALTLQALRLTYPDREFVLVIGADNWQRFSRWYRAGEILARHSVIVFPRRGAAVSPRSLPPGVTLAPTPLIDISATDIRRRIAAHTFDGSALPPPVWQEIQSRGYYQSGSGSSSPTGWQT